QMTIEEHGAGKQLIRFRVRPRFVRKALVLGLLLGLLGVAAAFDGAQIASVLLAVSGVTVILRSLQECAVSMATVIHTLNLRSRSRRLRLPALDQSEIRET